MKKHIAFFFLIVLLLFPALLYAWGREGHHLVIEIAYDHLSPASKQKLQYYLGGMSIDDASTWMDDVRKVPAYKYLEHTHYINIEKGQRFDPAERDNIFSELKADRDDLQHASSLSDDRVKMDLLILIHLVGDLHQPLHDGYAIDKGGNEVNVLFNHQRTNLHTVWDSKIIEANHLTVADINKEGARYSTEQVAAIRKVNIENWLMEARSYLGDVYAFQDAVLDERYLSRASVIIEDQIFKAGIRLAALLELYLSKIKGGTEHPANAIQQVNTAYTGAQAAHHMGETITVCDKVYGTKYLVSAGTQPTFLNLGAPYPNSPFTVVIFGKDRPHFKQQPEVYYDYKKICVSGLVKEYRGKPEMVVSAEGAIQVVQE